MMPPRITVFSVFAMAFLLSPGAGRAEDKLLGTKPPEWQVSDWMNSEPLALKDLAGKVVLVRWWTAPDCFSCTATAPALNAFHARYKEQGLVVVGPYHHKAATPLERTHVQRAAEVFGFRFPVAVDPEWQTLRRWWLTDGERRWTSVSFLLDRQGVIRNLHSGSAYVRGDKDYVALRARIEELLQEK